MKRLLMVAYHFPPLAGSSGLQRTLRFAQHLPALGWTPVVLTVHPRAYEQTGEDSANRIPPGLEVHRAFALDARRHLAVARRYPGWLARPDRWTSWLLGGLPTGWALVRLLGIDALWSTYPIASAHLLGAALAAVSGRPWIADFRDPMAHEGYPSDAATQRSYLWTEQRVFARARAAVFATEGAARLYRARYPQRADRIHVIENGYDESSFAQAATRLSAAPLHDNALTLLHSGIVYPQWRHPGTLLQALRTLRERREPAALHLRLRFRAPQHDAFLREQVRALGLQDVVDIEPPVGYEHALREMLQADGLLVLQNAECDDQIPAKLYEYLRARRPVLGLAGGDTAQALRAAGIDAVAPLEDLSAVTEKLSRFAQMLAAGQAVSASEAAINSSSREGRARQLADLLDRNAAGIY